MRTLLIGCGSRRQKLVPTKIVIDGQENINLEWKDIEGELVTLDNNQDHNPDILHDLNSRPLPFRDEWFDEILSFEVLEHIGKQGDYKDYFEGFYELWRILKPDGRLIGTVPKWDSPWSWGDPSHTRVLPLEGFVFLNQAEYEKQVGRTAMSNFTNIWKGDFIMTEGIYFADNAYFNLRAIK